MCLKPQSELVRSGTGLHSSRKTMQVASAFCKRPLVLDNKPATHWGAWAQVLPLQDQYYLCFLSSGGNLLPPHFQGQRHHDNSLSPFLMQGPAVFGRLVHIRAHTSRHPSSQTLATLSVASQSLTALPVQVCTGADCSAEESPELSACAAGGLP
jgi:hypothetical protein